MAIETQSKIGLISKALLVCQEHATDSTNNERYGVEVAKNLFEIIYENELQTNPWRFNMKKASLSRLNVEPVNQYKYVFQIPVDCLLHRFVYPPTDYEVYGDRIYANQTSIDLDYQFKPDVDKCPAYFALLMVYPLAKDMIQPAWLLPVRPIRSALISALVLRNSTPAATSSPRISRLAVFQLPFDRPVPRLSKMSAAIPDLA